MSDLSWDPLLNPQRNGERLRARGGDITYGPRTGSRAGNDDDGDWRTRAEKADLREQVTTCPDCGGSFYTNRSHCERCGASRCPHCACPDCAEWDELERQAERWADQTASGEQP